jgi:uncharacterized protein
MTHQDYISKTIAYVKQELHDAEGGHDWFHIERVWKNSKFIAELESDADLLVVELGALLHDIADSKFHNGDEKVGPQKASAFLKELGINTDVVKSVIFIIENISYKGGTNETISKTSELEIVQDADRLDAIGAIGIARTFNYGGFKNHKIYDPAIPPQTSQTKQRYKNSNAPTLNHFYEKLLLLKDLMNTETGKKLAQQRHDFMEGFLEQFYTEWNAENSVI